MDSSQLELKIMCRLDAPSIVDPKLVMKCKTYREAVQLCWALRKVVNMTKAQLAEHAGLYASHVTNYLKDGPNQRNLPPEGIPGFEMACNNTAISQWLSYRAKLTVAEETQAVMHFMRLAA